MQAGCLAEPFADLLFRELYKIELIDPWRVAGHPVGLMGSSLLAGAMALYFGDLALICSYTASVRPHGTGHCPIAAWSGNGLLSLGYRVSVVPTEDAGLVLPAGSCGLTVSAKDLRFRGLLGPEPPLMLLQRLTECEGVGNNSTASSWRGLVPTDSTGVRWNGAIEFPRLATCTASNRSRSIARQTSRLGSHPASATPFVLEGRYWLKAQPRDWPGL